MENIIIAVMIATMIGAAVRYIYKARKRGVKCIGCPSGCSCNGNCKNHFEAEQEKSGNNAS